MLTNYLNKVPLVKFVLLQDRLGARCDDIFQHLVQNHLKCGRTVHYFSCERHSKYISDLYNSHLLKQYNLLTDTNEFLLFLKSGKLAGNNIIVIDSMALLLATIPANLLYATLNQLKNEADILQILCVLHVDTIKNAEICSKQLQYLSDLWVEFLKAEQGYGKDRVLYFYRKTSGKIVRKYENLNLVNGSLISEPVKKINVEKLLETQEANPEEMASFRIGLGDKEKEARDNLALPYLPKANENSAKVLYEMEEADDWDPEDPDDDLDF